MTRLVPLTSLIAALSSLGALVYLLIGMSCRRSTTIVISWPVGYVMHRPVYVESDSALISLPDGLSILVFSRGDKRFATVLDVYSGGDVYVTLKEDDFCPLLTARESRPSLRKDTRAMEGTASGGQR